MNGQRYTLEPCPGLDLDKCSRSVKDCPCCKINRDGKFVRFKWIDNRGYCHSCGQWFSVERFTCHGCKMEKAFNRYKDTESENAYLAAHVDKCLFCLYHYTPKQYFQDSRQEGETPKS